MSVSDDDNCNNRFIEYGSYGCPAAPPTRPYCKLRTLAVRRLMSIAAQGSSLASAAATIQEVVAIIMVILLIVAMVVVIDAGRSFMVVGICFLCLCAWCVGVVCAFPAKIEDRFLC